MSGMSWDDLEPKRQTSPLTGPEQILSGKGCRLILKTTFDETERDANLLERLYKIVALLAASGCPGMLREPAEGHIRIYGGEPALYVQGTDQKSVITTIGKGVLSASASVRLELDGLGIRALVEW